MRTDKRTDDTQWQAIDVMSDECVGWFDTDLSAYQYGVDNDVSLSVLYRPKRKKVSR